MQQIDETQSVSSRDRVQDLTAFELPSDFRGRNAVTVQLWWCVQDTLFRWSPQFAYSWRSWLLRLFGARIGKNVKIRPSVRITYPWKLTIEDNCWVGDFAELYTLGNISIGHDAVVSQYAYLCTGSHDYRRSSFDIFAKPIIIEAESWVAAGAFVYPGVRVGQGAVIAAKSVLTTDAAPGLIYKGHPAKPHGRRLAST